MLSNALTTLAKAWDNLDAIRVAGEKATTKTPETPP